MAEGKTHQVTETEQQMLRLAGEMIIGQLEQVNGDYVAERKYTHELEQRVKEADQLIGRVMRYMCQTQFLTQTTEYEMSCDYLDRYRKED